MIQGKGQVEFHENIMKPFIEKIMTEQFKDIIFINKMLKSLDNAQKRKVPEKTDKCDLCGRMFAGIGGLKTHKTRAHRTEGLSPALTRSDSIKSESSLSPPPKKIFYAPKEIATALVVDIVIEIILDVPRPASGPSSLPAVPPTQVLEPLPTPGMTGPPGSPVQEIKPTSAPVLVDSPDLQTAAGLAGPPGPPIQELALELARPPCPPFQMPELQSSSELAEPPAPLAQKMEGHPAPVLEGQPGLSLQSQPVQEVGGPSVPPEHEPMEGYELENRNSDTIKIKELNTLIMTIRLQHAAKVKEMNKKEREDETKYKSLLAEKEMFKEALIKVTNDSSLKIEMLEAEMEKVKVKTANALKSFRFETTESEAISINEEIDECVVNIKCKGNCTHITCRMQTMRLQGGRRTSPGAEPDHRSTHSCPQCEFNTSVKSELDNHVQSEHGSYPNCPFCQVGFTNLTVLRKHIDTMHAEPSGHNIRPSVIVQKNSSIRRVSQKQCIFFLQPRGCKKGSSCDFSHNSNNQQPRIKKVRKLCFNGPTCTWKPSCKYVHLEDGETIPPRSPRQGGRVANVGPSNQGFVAHSLSQPPPGYSPPLASMVEFPGLPQMRRPSVFRQNPQFQ